MPKKNVAGIERYHFIEVVCPFSSTSVVSCKLVVNLNATGRIQHSNATRRIPVVPHKAVAEVSK